MWTRLPSRRASSGPSARSLRQRDQVRGVFARVLGRDPGVRLVVNEEDDSLDIFFRDKKYCLSVNVGPNNIHVWVTKQDSVAIIAGDGDYQTSELLPFGASAFFHYVTSPARLGKLRQTALILFKKMEHAEVWEVMNA